MTPEQINAAIAESLGWEDIRPDFSEQFLVGHHHGHRPNLKVPDYFHDLNACHEMEKALSQHEDWHYRRNLACIFTDHPDDGMNKAITATAPQRCEAYLKTKGLWKV